MVLIGKWVCVIDFIAVKLISFKAVMPIHCIACYHFINEAESAQGTKSTDEMFPCCFYFSGVLH